MEYILAHPEHILQHPSGTTHILSLITYLPLLGAIIIALFLPRGNQRAVKSRRDDLYSADVRAVSGDVEPLSGRYA